MDLSISLSINIHVKTNADRWIVVPMIVLGTMIKTLTALPPIPWRMTRALIRGKAGTMDSSCILVIGYRSSTTMIRRT